MTITLLAALTVSPMSTLPPAPTFADDVAFLQAHTKVVLLKQDGAAVALVPAWQGRVVTSTPNAASGTGNGWINYDHIKTGKFVPHINVFGGEDRFWIGPEGGQFSVFFKSGDPFDLTHWQTPPLIDTEPFAMTSHSNSQAVFEKTGRLVNYWGTVFDLKVKRVVQMRTRAETEKFLGAKIPASVQMVAYETQNTLTNVGDKAWAKDTGLLSIWILGMLKHSPTTTVVAPYVAGDEAARGPIVNDTYFGKVPADRLKIGASAVYFKADGKMRTKIGLSPRRAKSIVGSYDPGRNLLTLMQYTKPKSTSYVNSMWEMQTNPFGGDVVNSYNDGPPAPGKKALGPFYELETSSPALALAPSQSALHMNRTMHFIGAKKDLEAIAKATLGVSLDEIVGALK